MAARDVEQDGASPGGIGKGSEGSGNVDIRISSESIEHSIGIVRRLALRTGVRKRRGGGREGEKRALVVAVVRRRQSEVSLQGFAEAHGYLLLNPKRNPWKPKSLLAACSRCY